MLDASYSLATENGAEVKTLPEVVDIFSGGTPKTGNPEYWEGGNIPFFAPGDVTRSVYALTTEKHITEMGLANCNSSLYPIDTVFLTARGTVGKVAIAGNPMAMNQSCFAFRGKDIPQSVVFQIIKHAVKSLKAKANGATFAAINTRDLGIERVAIPSKDAMHAYDRDASVWLSEILTNEKENLRLANLRDALLPKLMSGEIDVSRVDLTQLNSHLDAPSHRLPGHLTASLIRVPRRKSSHPRRDLMCRNFSSFPRLGREQASQRHVKGPTALLPYRKIGRERWRNDNLQPATCGFVSGLRNYLPIFRQAAEPSSGDGVMRRV